METNTRPCDGPDCDAEVHITKPSKTGDHYCSKRACQNYRQKMYMRRRRAAELAELDETDQTVDEARMEFIRLAVHGARPSCPRCGLANGVVGYLHRASVGGPACDGLGQGGAEVGIAWIDLIHPDLAPQGV